jgi:hypothetical protein
MALVNGHQLDPGNCQIVMRRTQEESFSTGSSSRRDSEYAYFGDKALEPDREVRLAN